MDTPNECAGDQTNENGPYLGSQPEQQPFLQAGIQSDQAIAASYYAPSYTRNLSTNQTIGTFQTHRLSLPLRSYTDTSAFDDDRTLQYEGLSYPAPPPPTQQRLQDDQLIEQELQNQGYHQTQEYRPQHQALRYQQNAGQLSQPHYQQYEHPRRHTNSFSDPDSGRSAVANTLSSGGLGPLERGFAQAHLNWFQVGRIFKAPCAEYASEGAVSAARQREDDSLSSFTTSAFEGLSNFHEVRHYIIVLVKGYHSLCLAYHTYGGQGTKKPSIEPKDHAIIYSGRRCPELLKGEPRLSKDPIRVINEKKPLHRASRVNFGKVHTIEHNRKLMPIGEIDPSHMNRLKAYLRDCTYQMYD